VVAVLIGCTYHGQPVAAVGKSCAEPLLSLLDKNDWISCSISLPKSSVLAVVLLVLVHASQGHCLMERQHDRITNLLQDRL
jgi:hypothetical protein